MIRAIIFDFGNVLEIPPDPQKMLAERAAVAARFGMTADALWDYLFTSEAWQKAKRGQISERQFWREVFATLGVTDPDQVEVLRDRLLAFKGHVPPLMRSLLRQLHGRYRLAVLSNTADPRLDRLLTEELGLHGLFDVIVSSAAEGLAKPEEAIYQLALERLGVRPEEALFIDDMERNTQAAAALGMQTITFTTPEALQAELLRRGLLDAPASP